MNLIQSKHIVDWVIVLRLHNMLYRILIVSLAFLSTQTLFAKNAAISTDVSNILSTGHWDDDETQGYYRFITRCYGSEHIRCALETQWINYHEDGVTSSQMIDSANLIELSNKKHLSFSEPTCLNKNCNLISLDTIDTFTFKQRLFKIKFNTVGQYRIVE